MDIIPLLLLLAVIWKINIYKPITGIDYEYSGKDSCQALRGLFALIIMIGHIRQQADGGFFMRVFDCTGHLAAAFFFFLSGYGLIKSLENNSGYLKSFPQKKLEKIIIPYVIVCCIYWAASYLPWGERYTLSDVLISFINGNPIANQSWYVIELIVLYFCFYISAVLFKENKKFIIISLILVCILSVIESKRLNFGNWWGNSTLGFAVGILWEVFEKKINKMMDNPSKYLLSLVICLIVWALSFIVAIRYYNTNSSVAFPIIRINAAIFPILIMIIVMKIRIESPILKFIGTISFEFYMIHGLIICICKNLFSSVTGNVIWSLCSIAITILVAYILHKLFSLIKVRKVC